jgi:ankyrin repeat protein
VKEFYAAVQDGDGEIVRRLLQAKPYLANAKNASGQTPLAFAKQKGNEEVADVISKAGGRE